MSVTNFSQLPPGARTWIFESSRSLEADELSRVTRLLEGFLERWTAHGADLRAAFETRYDRFVFIGVDQGAGTDASGCSIDALFREFRSINEEFGTDFLDRNSVSYVADGRIERVSRKQFAELAREGTVDRETTVFDNTLTEVGAIRAGKWETSAGNSWHRSAFWPADQ